MDTASGDLLTWPAEVWIPCTPAGTDCGWLASPTEDGAWVNLLRDAAHMPYAGKKGFIARGYTVNLWIERDEPR